MITIFRDINGVRTEVCSISDKNAVHKSAIMGADEVDISVTTDSALNIQEGDYIVFNEIIYMLNRDAEYTIESDVKYDYELVFEHTFYALLNKLLTNRITGLTNFSLTGKLIDFVQLIIWNINQSVDNPTGVDNGWDYGYIEDTDFKNITFADINCYDALRLLATEFECEFYFVNDGKIISFVERIEHITDYVFEQGRENGLYKITQQNVDREDTITRLYIRGGNQNVPPAYADEEGYLKLPENYLENFSEHKKIVEKKVKFEEEYPKFVGTVESVSGYLNETITCTAIDFDLSAIAVGTNARINFLTGYLMGNSFEFQWENSLKRITLIAKEDETALAGSDGTKPTIPSASKKANVGDMFNFTGVIMPEAYVNASITRLREKGTKWLDFYSKKRVKFTIDIDYRWMRGKRALNVGDIVLLSIPQREFFQTIRITQVEIKLNTGEINATVSNYLEDSWKSYDDYRAGLIQREILGFQTNITIINGVAYRDRGVWNSDTAVIKPYLFTSTVVDDVWYIGCKWRCQVNKTPIPPSFATSDWTMIEGRSDARMEFDSSNGFAFFAGQVDTTITPVVLIGNANVSADIVEEQWSWTRISGDQTADTIWNLQHVGVRVLQLRNEDMGTLWSKTNPVRFTCTATYPASAINQITNYIEV